MESSEKVALVSPRNLKTEIPDMATSRHQPYKAIKYQAFVKTKLVWRLIVFLVCCQALLMIMNAIKATPKQSVQITSDSIVQPQESYPVFNDEDNESEANQIEFESSKNYFNEQETLKGLKRVVLGTVSCSKKAENHLFVNNTLVMLKSVVISAKLNGVSFLDLYIFLEYAEHEGIFREHIASWFDQETNSLEVTLNFYNAVDVVPENHRDSMVYHHRFRCGYVRMFFPSVLPDLDSLIYLDADIIVTGNIHKLWTEFSKMKDTEMLGVARDQEEENTFYEYLPKKLFGELPFVPPKGVNSGVLLMNLTKMRNFDWEEKLLKLNADYGQIANLNDQIVLNVFLYYNPYLVKLLDCSFNFIHTHCDKGFVCPAVELDPVGINLVHGANRTFQEGGVFRPIWEAYQNFNMLVDNLQTDLIDPLKRTYQANSSEWSLCYGTLDKFLFKVGLFGDTANMVDHRQPPPTPAYLMRSVEYPGTPRPRTSVRPLYPSYGGKVIPLQKPYLKGDPAQDLRQLTPQPQLGWYLKPVAPSENHANYVTNMNPIRQI